MEICKIEDLPRVHGIQQFQSRIVVSRYGPIGHFLQPNHRKKIKIAEMASVQHRLMAAKRGQRNFRLTAT
jgi:hypothetical protein